MRLIDAEALEEKIENLITRFKALGRKQVAEDYNFVLTVLSTAPTIEAKDDNHIAEDGKKGVKIPVISMEDVPKIMEEMEK